MLGSPVDLLFDEIAQWQEGSYTHSENEHFLFHQNSELDKS